MATIVLDHTTNKLYVLIGVGFGSARTARPIHALSGSASTSSESEMVAVADSDGEISWLPSSQLSVHSVDGVSCRSILSSAYENLRGNNSGQSS